MRRGSAFGVVLGAALAILGGAVAAQPADAPRDSVATRGAIDTLAVIGSPIGVFVERSPTVAVRRSLIVPGWGQVYNRDYLKAGVAAAGVAGLVTFAVVLNGRTTRFRRAAIYADGESMLDAEPDATNPNPEFVDEWIEAGGLSASLNRSLRDQNRRNRDFSILLSMLVYSLQALDAYVSAELSGFDVSEDLSLRVAPTSSGATATLRWRFGAGPAGR